MKKAPRQKPIQRQQCKRSSPLLQNQTGVVPLEPQGIKRETSCCGICQHCFFESLVTTPGERQSGVEVLVIR